MPRTKTNFLLRALLIAVVLLVFVQLSLYLNPGVTPATTRALTVVVEEKPQEDLVVLMNDATAVEEDQAKDPNVLVQRIKLVHPKPNWYYPPQMAWLMSYPNSGTSYTLQLVRSLSHAHVATNYGHENKLDPRPSFPVYEDQPNVGPFWMDLSIDPTFTFPKDYVIVKTHCGGRCETCGPKQYAETTYSFKRACRRGKRRIVDPKNHSRTMDVQVHYPDTRVTKAIHLIRDAFDNVVSRFHMETRSGRSAMAFNQTKEGFRQYCQVLNQRFLEDEKNSILFDEQWLNTTEGIPCRADFFRWIEWHNQAFHLTRDMGLETMIVEYGDYATQFNSICNQLLDFLNLLRHGDPEPFVQGKTYRDYFSADERKRMGTVLEQMATRETWHYVAKYFKG